MPKLFSYVVEHDRGHAPNPYGVCTLCRCKFRKHPGRPSNVVELADLRDWVVGTGGKNKSRSAGHGKLVFAMRVDEKLTRQQYYLDSRFQEKKPVKNGSYEQQMGDNKRPIGSFKRNEQFVLISRHFYYFGRNAVRIPTKFREHARHPLEKKGPGFRYDFDEVYVERFAKWLTTKFADKTGKQGEPWMMGQVPSKRRKREKCKSSC